MVERRSPKPKVAGSIPVAPASGNMNEAISVSDYIEELNGQLRSVPGRVIGEVTKVTISARGHCYFNLKDEEENAILDCKMWQSRYQTNGLSLEEGMKIVVSGKADVYPPTGRLSLTADQIEAAGEGELVKAYRILLEKVTKEGMLARKRELPEFISNVAVVSSIGGVVKKDLLSNLRQLGLKVTLVHAAMEGTQAPTEIVRAIEHINQTPGKFDVLVLIRGGGGNYEILQAFNNEAVVRALFASEIPTIAGIGHDVDVPIASLVADMSASTPTGVAHIINASWDSAIEALPQLSTALVRNFERLYERSYSRLRGSSQLMISRVETVMNRARTLMDRVSRGQDLIANALSSYQSAVKRVEDLLNAYNPERNLALGYSILRGQDGQVLKSVKSLKKGDNIQTQLADGLVDSTINEIKK